MLLGAAASVKQICLQKMSEMHIIVYWMQQINIVVVCSHMGSDAPIWAVLHIWEFSASWVCELQNHGVIAISLQILLTDTCQLCGWWSVVVCIHRRLSRQGCVCAGLQDMDHNWSRIKLAETVCNEEGQYVVFNSENAYKWIVCLCLGGR